MESHNENQQSPEKCVRPAGPNKARPDDASYFKLHTSCFELASLHLQLEALASGC